MLRHFLFHGNCEICNSMEWHGRSRNEVQARCIRLMRYADLYHAAERALTCSMGGYVWER